MLDITVGGNEIQSFLSPQGALKILSAAIAANQPFPESTTQLLKIQYQFGASKEIQIGTADTATLGITADTQSQLQILWPNSPTDTLQAFEMTDYFTRHPGSKQLLVVLTMGAKADGTAAASIQYSPLTAGVNLGAGIDASYGMVRAFPQDTPAEKVIIDFFKQLRLPGMVTTVPAEGDAIQLEYGGYLSFGANLGLGYQISGSPSQKIGQLMLSENYNFSLIGKLGLSSRLAGQFTVTVKKGSKDGWARVTVNKSKNKNFQAAADIDLGGGVSVEGLPGSADDFLSALLGIKAQNWLNLFEKIKDFSDFQQLEKYLDDLGKSYIEEFTGKVFKAIDNDKTFQEVKDAINKALDSYRNLGNYAVSIFDKYYDPIAQKVDDEVVKALDEITKLTSPDQLRGTVLGDKLAELINLITDGHPLDWLAEKIKIDGKELPTIEELKTRAQNVLDLIKDDAHKFIRNVIILAKSKFPLDKFISQLHDINLDELNAQVNLKLTGFVERIIGKSIDGLSQSDLGKLVKKVNKALSNIEEFKNNLYDNIKKSMTQSFQFQLALGYNRDAENKALVDVEINLADPRGKELMKSVGWGNYSKIFENYDPQILVIHEGVLTHQVTSKSNFSVNVVGWHKNFKYQSITTLLTSSHQCIRSEENGMLTITTDFKLGITKEKTRNSNKIYTNFVLGFVGASKGAVQYDPDTKQYLVDTITKTSNSYSLEFQAHHTTKAMLQRYLGYAVKFGIKQTQEEIEQAIIPTLPFDSDNNYGSTSLDYEARFSQDGLQALFTTGLPDSAMRRIIRMLTWSSYINSGEGHLRRIGWCYWSTPVYDFWKNNQPGFPDDTDSFDDIDPAPISGIPTPGSINLDRGERFILNTLYNVENSIVDGFDTLLKIIQEKKGFTPKQFESKLRSLGSALKQYDGMDESVNTFFALFDAFIKATGHPALRASSLTLKAHLEGKAEITKMLMA